MQAFGEWFDAAVAAAGALAVYYAVEVDVSPLGLAVGLVVATVVSVGSAAVVTRGADHDVRAVYQTAVAIAKKEVRFG